MSWKTICASFAGAAMLAMAVPAIAEDDPGPGTYSQALKGKRVVLVPMAMGFDLAQGWAAYLKREIEGWGGVFETRDPNWSIEAGAQAITDVIASDPKPDVLVVHAPDLNSYVKLFKKAQENGTYVILIDNPANFAADAFIGSDWNRLGQLEAEAAVKACGDRSSKQIGIMKVLEKYPDFKVVAKPDSNWDATTARNVTATMLQQNPEICAIIDFWDGDASGTASAIRDAGKEGKIALVTTGGGEKVDCDKLQSGEFTAVVTTELQKQSGDMNALIKFLLQSGQPPGTSKTYIYTLEKAYTKADIKPDTCWDVKALQTAAQ
jgi:ribose transport system substrate-binding protein